MRIPRPIGMLPILAIFLAACGPGSKTVDITMKEYQFDPDVIELKVGQNVTLNFENQGSLTHEFMAGHGVAMMEDGTPHGYMDDFFASAGAEVTGGIMDEDEMGEMGGMDGMAPMGLMVTVASMTVNPDGGTASVSFTVTPEMVGRWEFGCFEDDGDHFDNGMKGTIIVSE